MPERRSPSGKAVAAGGGVADVAIQRSFKPKTLRAYTKKLERFLLAARVA